MITVACYAVYRGADPRLLRFFRQEARRNATLALGVDIMFFRKSRGGDNSWLTSTLWSMRESWRDFCWYLKMLLQGHLILPLPALVTAFECWLKPTNAGPPPFKTVAALYSARWPNAEAAEEIMATYLRFVAAPRETYGLQPFDGRFHSMLRRWKIYCWFTNFLFATLKPRLYLAIYSGYLHHNAPCKSAIHNDVPTLVLGCSDCLYRISNHEVPRQFEFIEYNELQPPGDCAELSARGYALLAERIKGSFDPTIAYMKVSAYAHIQSQAFWAVPDVGKDLQEISLDSLTVSGARGFVTVFMHELNDWHHNGVLPPFATSYYEWLHITLAFLLSHHIPYILKIHPCIVNSPSSYSASIDAVLGLASQLDARLQVTTLLSTTQLIDAGMKLGVTVRGTVALELAFLQIPFLCAGRPPYAALFPNRIEQDLDSYQKRLLDYNKESAISSAEAKLAAYYVALQQRSTSIPIEDIRGAIPKLAANDAYEKFKGLL